MAFKFNGTVVTFPGSASPVRVVSITAGDGTGKIDITGATQPQHEYEAALDDVELTFEVLLGDTSLDRGDTGGTTVTWFDGSSTTVDASVVVGKSKTGSIDGAIVTSITIVPAEA